MSDEVGGLNEESTEAQDDAIVRKEKVFAAMKAISKAVKFLSMGDEAVFIVFVYVEDKKPKVYMGGDIDERIVEQLEKLLDVD